MATVPTADYISDLERTVDETTDWLVTLPDDVVRWRPRANAWSPIEIMGHLIDSAANNHQRFVRIRGQDDLVFSGYEQDAWVGAQAYQTAPWREVVTLWNAYNRHLARVMRGIPSDVRYRQHDRHNMDRLGWQPYAADQPATLDDLMYDYVKHLEHHLAQVRERVNAASTSDRA